MKKKGVIVSGIIVILLLIVALILLPKAAKNGITKYQLLEKVTEQFGITEYTNKTPYYADVVANNEYFNMVQSAKERGIIAEESIFNGDEIIDGRYIVLTAMKAIEKYKIQIYLESKDAISDDDYINLALEKGIIEKSQLKKGVTEEQCNLIISKVVELDKHGLWKDDFYEVSYKETVIEIEAKDIIDIADNNSQIKLSDTCANSLQVGNIIVFEIQKTGEKIAKRISKISDGNILLLEDAEWETILESVIISDITAVTNESMIIDNDISYVGEYYKSLNNRNEYRVTPVFHSDGSWSGDGFQKELEIGDGTIIIGVTDLYVGIQILGSSAFNIQYVNVQTEANIDVVGEFSVEKEWISPPIFKTTAVLAGGVATVDLEFYLVLSADGSVSIETRMPAQIGVEYADGRLHTPQVNVSMESAEIVADCEAGCYVRTEVVPGLFGVDLIDAEADIGANVTASVTTRMNETVWMCADMSINYPIIKLMLWGDENLKPIIKNKEKEPKVWEIMNADNAFVQDDMHCEWYSDGTHAIVEECTCGKFVPLGDPHMYTIYFSSDITKEENYYQATGMLTDAVYIPETVLNGMSIGDTYTYDGFDFIYTGKNEIPDYEYAYHDFEDRNGNQYTVFEGHYGEIGTTTYYFICKTISKHESGYRDLVDIELVLYTDYNFKIVDYTDVWVYTEIYNGKNYGIEEIFEKNIKDYEGKSLIHNHGLAVGATFNDQGEVHSMSLEKIEDKNETVLVYPF